MRQFNDNPLLQELGEEQTALIMSKKDLAGCEGAFYRLAEIIGPDRIGDWVEGEIMRSTNAEDMSQALGQYAAYIIFQVAMSSPNRVIEYAAHILSITGGRVIHLLRDECPDRVVTVNYDTGNVEESTTTGILRDGK